MKMILSTSQNIAIALWVRYVTNFTRRKKLLCRDIKSFPCSEKKGYKGNSSLFWSRKYSASGTHKSLIPTAWTQGNHTFMRITACNIIEALLTRVDAGNLEIVLSWWFSRSLHLILIWRGLCFYSWMIQISLYVVWK